MLISHNWLKTYFKNPEKLPAPEKIADLFTMHAFEIESLEQKGDDYIYDIKITPDRGPYAYGLRYVALELSLIVPELVMADEIRLDITNGDLQNTNLKVNHELVNTFLHELCPVYSLTKIENVNNKESSDWIKKSLLAIGQNPKSLLVDLTNFIMFDVGQPLHVFDADKVEGQIHVDLSKEGESITILGGKEIKLETNTLVIRDSKDILAIAGVKGGIKAEVDANTKNVYLESANFNQAAVRKIARSLNLLNDSSKRFEQGLNKERFLLAIQDYSHLLAWNDKEVIIHDTEISDEVNNIFDESKKKKIEINIDKVAKIIDAHNSQVSAQLVNFIENILPKTGAEIIKRDDGNYAVIAPYHRSDMVLDVDIADEFMRNKNYDFLVYDEHFKAGVESVDGLENDTDKLVFNIRKFFQDRGFDEAMLHTLVDSKENGNAIVLENSLTADRDSLRGELSHGFNNALNYNIQFIDLVSETDKKPIVKLFELGKVFANNFNDVDEKLHLAFGMVSVKGKVNDKIFKEEKEKVLQEFSDAFSKYFDEVRFKNALSENAGTNNPFMFSRELCIGDLSNVTVPLDHVEAKPIRRIDSATYKKASLYPSMSRDVAFFVNDSTGKTEGNIDALIKAEVAKQPLIENYFRFDIFQKEGKTSYAYRFVFQSYEKTLTEEETKEIVNSISGSLVTEGFEVR